jgi:hypothetical protein
VAAKLKWWVRSKINFSRRNQTYGMVIRGKGVFLWDGILIIDTFRFKLAPEIGDSPEQLTPPDQN